MSILATQIKGYMERSSWIRKMFETGAELKRVHGEDAVCDFSLATPTCPRPRPWSGPCTSWPTRPTSPCSSGTCPTSATPTCATSWPRN